MKLSIELKKKLFDACQDYVEKSIAHLMEAMESSQESANADTKGSAGDKHETGRAMMHLEKEKNAKQLAERLNLRKVLPLLYPNKIQSEGQLGSLIKTNNGFYYLSIPMGKLELEGKLFYIISAVSPIGNLLLNTKVGSEIIFNGQKIKIEGVI